MLVLGSYVVSVRYEVHIHSKCIAIIMPSLSCAHMHPYSHDYSHICSVFCLCVKYLHQ